jgi:hypothetical protein
MHWKGLLGRTMSYICYITYCMAVFRYFPFFTNIPHKLLFTKAVFSTHADNSYLTAHTSLVLHLTTTNHILLAG